MSVSDEENKATLVTALYNHSPQEILGGRGWSFDFYAAPFKNVLNLGLPIKIYTHKNMMPSLIAFMKKHATAEYSIKEYNLREFKYSDLILNLRKKSGKFKGEKLKPNISELDNDRNYHLCLSKIFWLNETCKENLFNSKNFFWIDAGLFHHGIFPEKYGGRERLSQQENNSKLYYPQNTNNIFSPRMGNYLSSKVNKFLSLIHKEMPIDDAVRATVSPQSKLLGYIVGGLFGGDPECIDKVCTDFDLSLFKCLNKKVLSLEENLFSCISGINPNLYETFSFYQWHHDIKGEPCYYGASSKHKSFYKIFKDDLK